MDEEYEKLLEDLRELKEFISFSDLKEKFSKNKSFRLGTIIVGSLIGLVLLYFAYRQFVWKPVNDKANNSYWKGQLQFNKEVELLLYFDVASSPNVQAKGCIC